jgi:hypothetical protein
LHSLICALAVTERGKLQPARERIQVAEARRQACGVSPIILILMGLPWLSRSIWVWVLVGLGGLAIAGLGAVLLGNAWDGYIAANPGYRGNVASAPPASTAVGTQASLAVAMVGFGYIIALIASFTRLRRTKGRWLLLRALAALTPVFISWLWLRHFFTFLVSNLCSDCSPPQPLVPGAFELGNNVLVATAVLSPILFLVFLAVAIFSFARTRRKPKGLPPS